MSDVATYPYPLVVFDLDGTLVDSAGDIAEALNRTLEDWQLPRVAEATVLTWIGDGVRRLVEQAFTAAGSTIDLDRVMPGFMVHYRECLLRSPRLFDGVAEALQQLQERGVPMAICTNKPEGLAVELVRRLGITELFGALVGADTLPTRKPDAAPYVASVTRAGGDVRRSMLIGDTETDRNTGLAVGVPVALVTFGPEGRAIERLQPEALLDHYDDLPALAARLLA